MITFLTVVAVLGTIALLLYALSAIDNKSLDKKQAKRESWENQSRTLDPKKVYNKNWNPDIPKPRICPACGTLLRKDEYLYASISNYTNSEGKRQAHIYGCKYCYLGETLGTLPGTPDMESTPSEVRDL